MSITRGTALAAAALMLTGCNGGGGGSADPKPSSMSSSASGTQSSTEPTATVEQYSSIVARNIKLQKTIRGMEKCDWLGSGNLETRPGYIVCDIGPLTMSLEAGTLATSLKSAMKPSAPAYIGAPPDELADLVDETITNADALEKAAGQVSHKSCEQTAAGVCSDLRIQTSMAMAQLTGTLDAWSPYL